MTSIKIDTSKTYSPKEIADMFGYSDKAIRARLRDAAARKNERLKAEGADETHTEWAHTPGRGKSWAISGGDVAGLIEALKAGGSGISKPTNNLFG